jgi:hypothetical protein
MTSEATRSPVAPIDPAERSVDARLARIHLRTGAFGLARAELETLAGSEGLDDEALLDLAEVRWRTGDLTGAGDAARAYLATGHDGALGFVIAAEAAAMLGRPGEARRLATLALERSDLPLDAVFAGLPRSGVWPTDPADPGEPVGALFPGAETPVGQPGRVAGTAAGGGGAGVAAAGAAAVGAAAVGVAAVGAAASGPGLWDETTIGETGVDELVGPDEELAAARVALVEGDADAAAVHLALALRLDSSVALAILEIAGSRSRPGLDLVRGDAYRVIGHDDEARRAYRAAALGLAASNATADSAPAADPPPPDTQPIDREDQ